MVLFVLAVLGITALVNVAVIAAAVSQGQATAQDLVGTSVLVSAAVLLIIGGVSMVKTLSLRQGGGVKVAESLGGVRLPDIPTDPKLKRYRNVVEEIAIASSTPVPVLYYLPEEAGINAFAAGYTPADAAVCVTQGSLDRLNRDELQGVIAHEFSHIVNGDMRLSIRLIGVLAGILALWVVGHTVLYVGRTLTLMFGRSRDRVTGAIGATGLGLLVLGFAVLVAGWLGVFFGRLIKAAFSRQREYLADASAVQFTRQTSGLTGALKKIGGLEAGSQLRSPKTENVSHMLFGEGKKAAALYATHPPLLQRIQVLEPGFTPSNLDELRQRWSAQPPDGLQEDYRMGFADAPVAQAAPAVPHAAPAARQAAAGASQAAPAVPQAAPRRVDAREYTASRWQSDFRLV